MKLLTTLQSALIGLANTAPTYGIAIAGGALLATTGVFSPLMVLICLFVIWGIFHAGSRLNALMPSYGSLYTWAKEVIHPYVGFLVGWFSVVALSLFLIYASVYTVTLFVGSVFPTFPLTGPVTLVIASVIIIILISTAIYGISITAKFQNFFTCIELFLLSFFVVFFAYMFIRHGLSITSIQTTMAFTVETFIKGFLLSIFFFWGWEVVFNIGEDSKDKHLTPKRSGKVTLIALAVIYILYMFIFSLAIPQSSVGDMTNLFSVLDNGIVPHHVYVLAIIAICISIIGGVDIAIIEVSKVLVAQSRDNLLPSVFSNVKRDTKAPVQVLLLIGGVTVIGIACSSYLPGVQSIIDAGVTISALLISCYYLLIGITWLVYLYKNKGSGVENLFLDIFLPIVSSSLFIFVIIKTFLDFDGFMQKILASIIAIGSVLYFFFAHVYKK